MPDPVTLGIVSTGINIGSKLLGNKKRRRAARKRRQANAVQRQQTAISNALARQRAVTQQRAALANARVAGLASGAAGSSAGQASIISAGSQLATGISRQRQKEAADVRISQLGQKADRLDSSAAFVESLGSTISSSLPNILGD